MSLFTIEALELLLWTSKPKLPCLLRLSLDEREETQMSIPHLFRCPISLDLFTDPVTLSTGLTYDRPCIERWLADGNLTCPVTMQRLSDASLVPNHTLRHLIDQWLIAGAADFHCRTKPTRSVNDNELSLAAVKQKLQSPDIASAAKLQALDKVRAVAVESDIGQACLIQLGFFPLLLQLLLRAPWPADSELIEVALDCVLSFSPASPLDSLNMLTDSSNLDSLMLLLDQGSARIKIRLCHLLEVIATSGATQELSLIVGQSPRVLQALVFLAQNKPDGAASEAAVRAIAGLCSSEANRGNAIREGAVDGIVSYLSSSAGKTDARALAALELLLVHEEGKRAAVRNPNAIPVLVKMVFKVPSDHKGGEHAVGSLLTVCCDSTPATTQAVDAGVVMQLLLLLQSQCSSKAKAKARALLKLVKSMWAAHAGGGQCNNDK
ncbi:U-box domain-containing protein 26-like isoform X1 [Musa acuminata AAA Group]|uniref:U-box domain-containing protein 26-like isoform X1 n=2 Tax=Musa acuminata AAA Group TaxID=214697 RepID=UPI0031DA57FD